MNNFFCYNKCNNIIDEYLNIIKFKNSIIEKLTNDNIKLMNDINNLNNIINDYKALDINSFESYDQDQCKIKYKDKRLRDFYIASSANSFLVG